MTSAKEVIAAALFEWGGSGQGVDDILAEIATAQAVAILAALDAAGLVVVPREPTEEMAEKGYDALMAWDASTGDDQGIVEVYRAMIAAGDRDHG